jgi:hypothetical protein
VAGCCLPQTSDFSVRCELGRAFFVGVRILGRLSPVYSKTQAPNVWTPAWLATLRVATATEVKRVLLRLLAGLGVNHDLAYRYPAIVAGVGTQALAGEGETIGWSDHAYPYTSIVAAEDTVLEEAMDNLKEAGQRIRATQSLMRSEDMTEGENHRDLLTHLSTALAMTEAAYLEARRRRDL